MTETSMTELGLFDGDTVNIKGKRGKKTIATVTMVSDSDLASLNSSGQSVLDDCHTIGMTADAMKNAGVRAGDAVKVSQAPDVKFGKKHFVY